jgi:hypothetical protein
VNQLGNSSRPTSGSFVSPSEQASQYEHDGRNGKQHSHDAPPSIKPYLANPRASDANILFRRASDFYCIAGLLLPGDVAGYRLGSSCPLAACSLVALFVEASLGGTMPVSILLSSTGRIASSSLKPV